MSMGETPASFKSEGRNGDYTPRTIDQIKNYSLYDWVINIPQETGSFPDQGDTAKLITPLAEAVEEADELLRESESPVPALVVNVLPRFDSKHKRYSELEIKHGFSQPGSGFIPNMITQRGHLSMPMKQPLIEIPALDGSVQTIKAPSWNSHFIHNGYETMLSGHGKKTTKKLADEVKPEVSRLTVLLPGGTLFEPTDTPNPFRLRPEEEGYRPTIVPQPVIRYDSPSGVKESLPTTSYQLPFGSFAAIGVGAIRRVAAEVYQTSGEIYKLDPRVSRAVVKKALTDLNLGFKEKKITGHVSRKQKKSLKLAA